MVASPKKVVPCSGRRPHPGTIKKSKATIPQVVLWQVVLPTTFTGAHTSGMPCLRTEPIHGVVCKFYDGGVVKVGSSAASRFTIKVPADEESWFSTRLRAELIKRELATAADLSVDEAGEAAMAAKAAAAAKEADKRAAWKRAVADKAADPRRQAAVALEAAEHSERVAGHKRALAEKNLELAEGLSDFKRTAPVARDAMGKAAELVKELAAKAAPEARAKVQAMAATAERAQSAQTKLEAFWGRIEVRTRSFCACSRRTSTSDLSSLPCMQAHVSFSHRALSHPERQAAAWAACANDVDQQ